MYAASGEVDYYGWGGNYGILAFLIMMALVLLISCGCYIAKWFSCGRHL